jgi:hypothetical protein
MGVWSSMVYSFITAPPQTDAAVFVSFGIGILLPLLFWQMKLTTRITQEGIYVRFFPFHFKEKFFAWDTITSSYVRSYSPLMEYGGWGIKYSFKGNGLVYNTAGNVGLQLYFKEGDPILIGTQKGEEIKQVLVALGHLNESVK